MRIRRILPLSLLATALVLAGCGKKDADQPLAFAPADSPWLLANTEPVPAAAVDAWWKNAEQMAPMYDSLLDQAVADLERERPGTTAAKAVRAVREELRGKFSREGLQSLGISPAVRSAAYGIGLVPVLRMELADAAAFRAFVDRIESKAGEELPEADVGGLSYWKLGGDDGKAMFVAAIQDQHLVLSVAPAQPSEALLRSLFGLDRPASNAVESGTLERFNEERKYLPYGSGYVDMVRLASLITGERSTIEQEFIRALDLDAATTTIGPECKAEFAALAAAVPRLSFGYRTLEAKLMDLNYAVEIEPKHGKALAGLSADVPGLDGRGEGMLDVGFGLDLDAFAGFVNVRAAQVAEKPFTCAALAPLNAEIAKANSELANPAVFMAGAAMSGLYASLTQLELNENAPPLVKGKIAIGSDNPLSLLQMAGGFLPQLASMNLEPGAAPVALPAGLLPPTAPPAHVAVSEKALAISLGEGEETGLTAFAAAAPGDPAPLLHYGVDGAGLKVFIDSMRKASQAALEAAEARAAMEAEASDPAAAEDGASDAAKDLAELRQAVATFDAMQGGYAAAIERVDFAVYATERGLEANYILRLK